MNILLDAYFDQNFGDDLFVDTITKLYPEYKFYAFMEYYPAEVQEWAASIPNLIILPECKVMVRKGLFDAYICVGGDIFPDNGDFTARKSWVDSIYASGGKVFFLGFSLFHEYSEKTQEDLREMMEKAELVATRDKKSATLLKSIIPGKDIKVMSDLAFFSKWIEKSTFFRPHEILKLGISVRRPGYADDAAVEKYCNSVAETINFFLKGNSKREVTMIALSNGSVKDEEIADKIIEKVCEKSRVAKTVYQGNIDEMKKELKACQTVICTRFHALVACIAMKIPFLPINYEVKMEHILNEVGYEGQSFTFDEIDGLKDSLEAFCDRAKNPQCCWKAEKREKYLKSGTKVMEQLQHMLSECVNAGHFVKKDKTGASCDEKEYAKAQAEMVVQKNNELEVQATEIRRLNGVISDCQRTIAEYLQTIAECQKINQSYFETIEEINEARKKIEDELHRQAAEYAAERKKIEEEKARLLEELQSFRQETQGDAEPCGQIEEG